MKKINIAELLKDCPKGMELDCMMYDNLYFDSLNADYYGTINCYILNDGIKTSIKFTKYGTFNDHIGAKCVIFPKGKTTWEGFVPPYKFKDGDIVSTGSGRFIFILKGEAFKNKDFYYGNVYFGYCIDNKEIINKNISWNFSRLATEEEKQKLFDAIKANGYKWNEETKTLEKLVEPKFKVGDRIKSVISSSYYTIVDIKNDQYFIKSDTEKYPYQVPFSNEINYKLVPNKFDITTLIPFESKVLVRDYDNRMWIPTFWGKRLEDNSNCNYLTTNGCYKYCIPYEDNEYLLGKTDDCDDFYKTWE